jgi:Ca2+-transporting ATPase
LARELVPGDLVSLSTGDRVPADVRIVEAIDLQIDESSFTGENEPRHKHINPVQSPDRVGVEHVDNVAFMGTLISSGRGKVTISYFYLNQYATTFCCLGFGHWYGFKFAFW